MKRIKICLVAVRFLFFSQSVKQTNPGAAIEFSSIQMQVKSHDSWAYVHDSISGGFDIPVDMWPGEVAPTSSLRPSLNQVPQLLTWFIPWP